MEAATQHRPAEFTEERIPPPALTMSSTVITRCWCGWETTSSIGARSQDELKWTKLSHRLDHMEGRIDDDE